MRPLPDHRIDIGVACRQCEGLGSAQEAHRDPRRYSPFSEAGAAASCAIGSGMAEE